MNILCLQDGSKKTELSGDLLRKIGEAAQETGNSLEIIDLAEGELAYCIGCLRCWATESEGCFFRDRMDELEKKLEASGLLLYITPVIFGTCTHLIKIAVEKGLGSNLFNERHRPQLFIGCAENLPENTVDDEIQCFIDIVSKHMGRADIVHPELSDIPVDVMATRSLSSNSIIAEKFKVLYLEGLSK